MAGKDINTWKMTRKEKYEKPTAVRMPDRDLTGVAGGQDDKKIPLVCVLGKQTIGPCSFAGQTAFAACASGKLAYGTCSGGSKD